MDKEGFTEKVKLSALPTGKEMEILYVEPTLCEKTNIVHSGNGRWNRPDIKKSDLSNTPITYNFPFMKSGEV